MRYRITYILLFFWGGGGWTTQPKLQATKGPALSLVLQ